MDDQQKPFDTVSIVLLIMIGLANDAAEIVSDLFAATVVGLSGEVIMEPVNLLIDGLITGWFTFKLGFGGPTLIQLVDDITELFGIPGRTICLALGIWLANNPRSKVGQLARFAGSAEALELGTEAEISGDIAATENATLAEQAGSARTEGGETPAQVETEKRPSEGGQTETRESEGGSGENQEDLEAKRREEEAAEELTPESEKDIEETERKKLLQEMPDPYAKDSIQQEEEPEPKAASLPPKKPPVSEKSSKNARPKVQDISSGRAENLRDYQNEENQENFGDDESEEAV